MGEWIIPPMGREMRQMAHGEMAAMVPDAAGGGAPPRIETTSHVMDQGSHEFTSVLGGWQILRADIAMGPKVEAIIEVGSGVA